MRSQSGCRKSLVLAACWFSVLFFTRISHSQVSVYGTMGVTNYGYSFNGNGLTIGSDRVGFAGGGFYNFPIQSRFTAGVDLRGAVAPGTNGGEKAFVAARFGFVPRHVRLRPYLQIGGGLIRANVPAFTNFVGAQTVTSGALDLALGVDCRLTSKLDLRLLELESGAGLTGNKEAASALISTGIVYHF